MLHTLLARSTLSLPLSSRLHRQHEPRLNVSCVCTFLTTETAPPPLTTKHNRRSQGDGSHCTASKAEELGCSDSAVCRHFHASSYNSRFLQPPLEPPVKSHHQIGQNQTGA